MNLSKILEVLSSLLLGTAITVIITLAAVIVIGLLYSSIESIYSSLIFSKMWTKLKDFIKRKFKKKPDYTSLYEPDNWVVIRILFDDGPIYKVYGEFHYSWRVNSGIKDVKEDEDFIYFYGYSGSLYKCKKSLYGINLYNSPLDNMISVLGTNRIKILPKSTNWKTLIK